MILSPSILSADWSRLADAVRLAEQGADWLHCDVMDGHFVPNLTFGPPMVAALHRMTKLPLDVHLMIDEPQRFAKAFAGAGATVLTIHLEAPGVAGPGWPAPVRSHGEGAADADPDATRQGIAGTPPAHARSIDLAQLRRSLAGLRTVGARVGLALRPDSKFEDIEPVAAELDLLLVMTVYPGFSGQEFLSGPLETVRAAAAWRRSHGAALHIEVDGGIQADGTGPRAAEAGADVLVAGHGIYRQPDPLAAMRALKALAPVA